MADHTRVALLIDCENISHKLASALVAETTKHGSLTVKRAYGDWASPYMTGWRQDLPLLAIQPFQQFSPVSGKNSSDAALIVDAMDLLYAGNVDVFVLASGDSDFTRLVTRLRESGRRIYGIGARTTHPSFINAFDRFTFTDVLSEALVTPSPQAVASPEADTKATSPGPPAQPETAAVAVPLPEVASIINRAVRAATREDGWALLATVGSYIVNNIPSFDSRNYGHPKLGGLVRSLNTVEVREQPTQGGGTQLQVRLRDTVGHT